MRPSSRQRVAAWLLALPLGRGGEECARRGRLEMISFWLLCWKLLRATTGLRRTTPELTDANHDNGSSSSNNPVCPPSPPLLVSPVTMEMSSSAPLTDMEGESLFSCHNQEEDELGFPGVHRVEDKAVGGENRKGDECDYLIFEMGDEKGREVSESERGEDEGSGEIEGEEEERGKTEGEIERREIETEDEDRGRFKGEDGNERETESDSWERREREGDDETRESTEGGEVGGGEEGEDPGAKDTKEEDRWIRGIEEEAKEDVFSDLLFPSDSLLHPSPSEPLGATSDPLEAVPQEVWGPDFTIRDDLSDSHLSDCLQAERVIVYSDSDAGEDQWSAFAPSDITSQIEEERKKDVTFEEEEKVKGEEEDNEVKADAKKQEQKREVEVEEYRVGRKDDDEDQMRLRRDLFLRSPSVSSTASSTDPDKKVPVDFCVHEETQSENVSTEHVDFLLARQQWKKMEEEVKGQPIPKPGLRAQGSFQGTHSSLYPPTRSPRLKHSSEDSGLDDSSYRSTLEEPETAVEREIRLTLEREERHRRERGMIAHGLAIPRPSSLQTGRSPPRPPACRTPTLSISPTPSCSSSLPRSAYHEMTANNVIILEPDSSSPASRNRLLSSAIGGLSDWPANSDAVPSANVIVVETSNLIIRSASEFCLSSTPLSVEPQESTFTSNPFFKLRSLSSQSLVEQEIRMVRQREEEWKRQREEMWRRKREEEWKRGRERYDTVLVSPGLSDNVTYNVSVVPDRSVSSPSSPSRTRKIERSSLSCDHKFPPSLSSVPRQQNAMAQRWEASLLANQKKKS
ncbi:uncharacterized protein si:ch211-153l6.6 isoform X2 [Oreochromis aureus]|uniref:uncharacterized protein si:ch211-153l6.6 isoform X2 n=1 Tax=Oreochromis aureus TaxID=47969 RepID=UPI001953C72E|nr:uncharacterized protein si:ch211-153l6.6 isoform X2 [Oreochromis aureus]